MVMSTYEMSNLGPTSKVKFIIQTYKVISDCIIFYVTLALATSMSRDTIVEKYFSKVID